jgi:hypothetical protein
MEGQSCIIKSRLDFCAECLDNFIRESLGRTDEDEKLPLGFTVGYLPLTP